MRLLMDHSLLQKQHWKLHNNNIIIGLKGSHSVAFFLWLISEKKKNLLFCLEMKKSFLYLLKKSETMNWISDIKIDINKSYQDQKKSFVKSADMRIKLIYKKKLQDECACDLQELRKWRDNPELWMKVNADFVCLKK